MTADLCCHVAMYAGSLWIHPKKKQFLDPKQLKSVKRIQIHAQEIHPNP